MRPERLYLSDILEAAGNIRFGFELSYVWAAGEGTMDPTRTSFKSRQAPCGQIVDGASYQDRDEEVLLTEELDYGCGCRSIRHEYHDGSVSANVVRHDGTVP